MPTDRMVLERAKREVMALRYKARRFEEIKIEFPKLRAKAHRYDALVSTLVPPALLRLIRKVHPMIATAARLRRPKPASR